MARTAMAMTVAAALMMLGCGAATATEVYWTPAHEQAPQGIQSSITWGDLDADGDADIARGSDFVCWNDGGCPGPPVWRVQMGVLPGTPSCSYRQTTLGDLDGDGDLDLIYGCFEPQLHMFWNVGTPQVPAWQYDPSMFQGGANYSVPFLADLDGDGDLDLIMVTGCAGAFFRENVGTPQAPVWGGSSVNIPPVYLPPPASIALGDLDGDGDLDFLGFSTDTPLTCWENVGTPQSWSFVENPAMLTGIALPPGSRWGLALPDLDCDGDLDLLVVVMVGYAMETFAYLNEGPTPVSPATWSSIKALYRQ
ncbi:MAG: VCBS repeat-containing protein [Candidatus Eisenbacteria bacterium]|nr:VCBS repeat-containing protein [Candidatus Eisenbacteria bacterium]